MWIKFFCAFCALTAGLVAYAENSVSRSFLKYEAGDAKLLIKASGLSNSGEVTTIGFNLECSDLPFSVDSVEIVVCDTVYSSLSHFSITGTEKDVMHKRVLWDACVEFPQLFEFSAEDMIRVYTSEGMFEIPLTRERALEVEMDALREQYDSEMDSLVMRLYVMRIWCVVAFIVMIICAVSAWILVRHSFRRVRDKERKLKDQLRELDEREAENSSRYEELVHKSFHTLNELCNAYFEKCDSERTKATLVGDMENIIALYRSKKAISELADYVNLNMSNILVLAREELPDLSDNDILLMTYLYAGFSARAVCLMMDLKLKNFYNRRSRLKERILASDSQNKEWFASKM